MWFDVLLLLFTILAFIRGWQKGLLWAVFSFIAVFFGILVSLKLSHTLANYLFAQNIFTGKYVLLFCFVILFIAVILVFKTVIKLVETVLDTLMLGWINKALGGFLYTGFVLLLFSMLTWLANKSDLILPNVKKESSSYQLVEPVGTFFLSFASKYVPLCKDLYENVEQFLDETNKNISEN